MPAAKRKIESDVYLESLAAKAPKAKVGAKVGRKPKGSLPPVPVVVSPSEISHTGPRVIEFPDDPFESIGWGTRLEDFDREVGRPKKLVLNSVTLKALHGLARLQTTMREGAAFFGVDLVTFEKFLEDPGVSDAWNHGRENGKMSLRRRQWNKAMEGDTPMLIHLGKTYLGQNEVTKSQVDVNFTIRQALLSLADGDDA